MKVMKKSKTTILVFLLPALAVFTFLGVLPLLPTIYYSFFDYKNLQVGSFIGISQYIKVFQDPIFHVALLNNLKLLIAQFLIGVPISFLCAVLITAQGKRVRRFYKISSFIPAVLSVSVICSTWYMLIQPEWGAVYGILNKIGLENLYKPWMDIPGSAYAIIIFTVIWQFIGYNMLLFYAGIKAIPESYFEAARIDGASMFCQVRCIMIPLLQETFKYVSILMITGTMGMIANVQLMTQGNNIGEGVYTSVFYIYYRAFNYMDFGYAYAVASVYALLGFGIVMIVNKKLAKNRLEYM